MYSDVIYYKPERKYYKIEIEDGYVRLLSTRINTPIYFANVCWEPVRLDSIGLPLFEIINNYVKDYKEDSKKQNLHKNIKKVNEDLKRTRQLLSKTEEKVKGLEKSLDLKYSDKITYTVYS